MKVVITRNMTVANSRGESETFERTPEGEYREDIDPETYRRLNRVGAAYIFVEESTDIGGEGDANSIDAGTAETASDLMKLNKADLIAKAKAEEVTFDGAATKQAIAEAIIAKREAAAA